MYPDRSKKALLEELRRLHHRIAELEQSDIQRQQMADALRESESQKQAILDASLDRIRHVDKNLKILWANKTTLDLDMSVTDVIGQTCHQLFVGRDTPCERCPNIRAMKTGRIERAVIFKPRVRGIVGETFWDLYIVPLKNRNGDIQTFFQIARNITDQKRAEDALRKNEEMFRGIFQGSPIGIAIYQSDGRLIDGNSAYREIFGISERSTLKAFNLFNEPFIPDPVKKKLRKFLPVRYEFSFNFGMVKKLKTYVTQKSGIVFLHVQITPMAHADNIAFQGYLVHVQDISHRKEAEEHIRSLTHELIKAQENERQKISRDLHDRVAQDLSTLKIGMNSLYDGPEVISKEFQRRISSLMRMLQGSIEAVRDLSYELRPPGLDQLGLVRTLFQYCEDFSEKTDIQIDFHAAGLDDLALDFDTEINLYRLTQEALHNVKKHAEADQVIVRLVASYPKIILRIEDNGKGFDVETRVFEAVKERHMGIQNMKERVHILNGEMTLRSFRKIGTKIVVEIPWKENRYENETGDFDYR